MTDKAELDANVIKIADGTKPTPQYFARWYEKMMRLGELTKERLKGKPPLPWVERYDAMMRARKIKGDESDKIS